MCWSGEASATLAAAGLGTAVWVARRGESKALWVPLLYFTTMEALQAATYVYIGACDTRPNQVLTLLGYLHIAFQPFFVNMVALYFIPPAVKQRVRGAVYALCALGSAAILLKAWPLAGAGTCVVGVEGFCGPTTCSMPGDWHIAWQMPLNGLLSNVAILHARWGLHAYAYIAVSFVLPIVYGSWRFVAFHYVVGPLVADVLTSNPNEYAAVWCLFSIALCVSVIKSPVRRHLHVERWLFYPSARGVEAESALGH